MFVLDPSHLKGFLQLLALFSAVTFLLSCFCIPLLIARLPADYFTHASLVERKTRNHPLPVYLPLLVLRNIVGTILLCAGIIMLFLPGQGIITIILGICLMSVPWKDRLIFTLTRPAKVQASLNWIRKKTGSPPFYW